MWIFPNDDRNTDLNITAIPLEISIIIKVELHYAHISLNVQSSLLQLGGVEEWTLALPMNGRHLNEQEWRSL